MNEEQEALLQGFFTHCLAADYTRSTANWMRRDVKRYFEYLADRDLKPEEARPADAESYQGYLVETGGRDGRPYGEGTIACFIKAASAFYEYLKSSGRVIANPFKAIVRIKQRKKLPQNFLKENEMSLLLEALGRFDQAKSVKESIRRYKTHVVAELLYSTGLRIREAARLTVADVDFERGMVLVEEGKGGRRRECFLNEYAREILRLYVHELQGLVGNRLSNRELLFGAGEDTLGKMVNRELRRSCRALKLRTITSHGFRHSLGVHLLRSGCDIRHIQEILGHQRLKNTEIYTRVDKEDLKSVLDACHPRTKFSSVRHDTEYDAGFDLVRDKPRRFAHSHEKPE
jgi:integrase/recombinase XerD